MVWKAAPLRVMPGTEEQQFGHGKRAQREPRSRRWSSQCVRRLIPARLTPEMVKVEPWSAPVLIALLEDATLVHLKCVGRRASEVVAAAARASGPCVRWPGEWWVQEDQRGVWKCLTHADLVRLPRIRLKMNTEWLFRCRCELVRFLNLASRLYFRDRLVLNAVIFHGADLVVHRVPPSKGREYQQDCDGYDLASEWVTVSMSAAVFQFRIVLSDETPREEEPTMALRVHVMPLGAGLDRGRDMVEVRALCPADLQYCSKHNRYLRRGVWANIFDEENFDSLPMLLSLESI